ncbi:hypothetical protein PSHT_13444 [Puccinia striiformis]|uniref:Uncharacterized protein n=1 Tax=Puccinia striiformis TaxID=27350 RepID=A0A2S4UQP6_9BASI|nr:hypothetical protein PSHT_13444 [Puccinia striiformis]
MASALKNLIPPKIASSTSLEQLGYCSQNATGGRVLLKASPGLNPFARYKARYMDGENASGAPLFHAMLGLFLVGYTIECTSSFPVLKTKKNKLLINLFSFSHIRSYVTRNTIDHIYQWIIATLILGTMTNHVRTTTTTSIHTHFQKPVDNMHLKFHKNNHH